METIFNTFRKELLDVDLEIGVRDESGCFLYRIQFKPLDAEFAKNEPVLPQIADEGSRIAAGIQQFIENDESKISQVLD